MATPTAPGSSVTYDRNAIARMIDFFTIDGTPWPRRLWDVGSLLGLEELWEAGSWAAQKVLSTAACDWQRNELRTIVGPDVGLGQKELRRELTTLLAAPLPDPSPARRRLKELIEHARSGYVDRWAAAVDTTPAQRPKPERLARTVASHLLDLGYDANHLAAWANELNARQATALEVVQSAATLAKAPEHSFDVLVVLLAVPERPLAEQQLNWTAKGKVIEWLKEHNFSVQGLRVGGGFRYQVNALDAYGAANQAREMVERMVARSSFQRSNRGGIVAAPNIWVGGHPQPISLLPPARGANILALVHEGHLYRVDGERRLIDDALELAAPLNQGALGPAVAGGWAAVESLLTHPDDPQEEERSGKAVAADRLAAIIACSWPRAELTALAHRHSPAEPDELSSALDGCTTNIERARTVAEGLKSGSRRPRPSGRKLQRHSDMAAIDRMARVVDDPRRELNEAVKTFRVALRRLYRTRNIVLHGGSTKGVALQATLRIGAPLVGAGLDRLAHAALTEGIRPLDLAARAELALKLVGGETALSVVELLEPRRG
ncbi:integrase [Micromonospora sp. NPDC047762]|uniref:integrase n=1 Tax=Micromonospora sp. NPDC047762 TaxID=3364255 RepID=UPI00371A679F